MFVAITRQIVFEKQNLEVGRHLVICYKLASLAMGLKFRALLFIPMLIGSVKSDKEISLPDSIAVLMTNFGACIKSINLVNLAVKSKSDLVDDVLKTVYASNKFTSVTVSDRNTSSSQEIGFCNVIMFDNFEDNLEFFMKFPLNSFDTQGYFLVANLDGITSVELSKLFKIVWNLKIANLNVVYENGTSVFIANFEPFSSIACAKNATTEVIPIVRALTSELELSKLFANKLQDLKFCKIRVATYNCTPFVMMINSKLSGRDVDLMRSIAKALKFKIEFVFVEDQDPWGYLFPNGTATGTMARLQNNQADIITADYFLKLDRYKFFDFSVPYFASPLIFIIPPPATLAPFEKLLRPFQANLWISLIIFYTIIVISIVLIFHCTTKARDVAFGSETKSPIMDLFFVNFGLSQPILPSKSTPRFILMQMIIFFLVMRSAYQGSLYRFLQTDKVNPAVKSLDDMIEKDFKFYIESSFYDLIEQQTYLKRK